MLNSSLRIVRCCRIHGLFSNKKKDKKNYKCSFVYSLNISNHSNKRESIYFQAVLFYLKHYVTKG